MDDSNADSAGVATDHARGKQPTRPLGALWSTVRSDRLVQAALAMLGALTLVHLWAALVQPLDGLAEGWSGDLGPFLMLLSTVASLVVGLDHLQVEERGFWRDISKTALEVGLWANPGEREEMVARLAAEGSIRDFEGTLRRRSGELRPILFSAERLTIDGERYLLS